MLVDCTGNDGGIVEDLYAIARTATSASYKVLFYLSTSVDYLRPGEGIFLGSIDPDTTQVTRQMQSPNILAPVPRVGSDAQFQALYVPKGKALGNPAAGWSNNTADTPIIGAQGGYY